MNFNFGDPLVYISLSTAGLVLAYLISRRRINERLRDELVRNMYKFQLAYAEKEPIGVYLYGVEVLENPYTSRVQLIELSQKVNDVYSFYQNMDYLRTLMNNLDSRLSHNTSQISA